MTPLRKRSNIINIDLIIIFLLLNNSIYNKYIHLINENHYRVNNREVYRLFKSLKAIKHQQQDRNISVEEFALFFFSNHPVLKPDEKQVFDHIFSLLSELSVSEDLAENYFTAHLQRVKASEIASIALDIVEGRKDYTELLDAVSEENKPTIDEKEFVTDDLQNLYDSTRHSMGLRWPLGHLNQSLGSLRVGDFGFIIARPETGKTTFVSQTATHMTAQHDGNTLWIKYSPLP